MFCKFCGKQIDDDSIFCSFCGTKQSTISQEVIHNSNSDTKTVNVNLSFGRLSASEKKETFQKVQVEKYDLTYQKESDATFIGALFLIISGAIYFGGTKEELRPIFAIFSLVIRIGVTIWCVNIAKRQNRDSFNWGLFCFFLPSIALIIIGLLKKLRKETIENFKQQTKAKSNTDIKETYAAPKYKVISTKSNNSLFGNTTYKMTLKFDDNEIGEIYIVESNGQSYFRLKPKGMWVFVKFLYEDKESCINSLHHFIKTNRELKVGLISRY